ncbi:hypothetical protein HZP59_18515 [Elizabethkingia anophelis]|nr:hypothetical protein [Elizabethkingia anophelis]
MENNLENKARFFAQYWGQKIAYWNNNIQIKPKLNILINEIDDHDVLELKPLSSITEEDAMKVSQIATHKSYERTSNIKHGKMIAQHFAKEYNPTGLIQISLISTVSRIIDYLRSRGYALPWMEISVQKLIEYGWVKLK